MTRNDDRLAHGIAIWACEPAGYAWHEVRGSLAAPEDVNAVRERLHENLRDRRTGDALDDALDRADAALAWELATTEALDRLVGDMGALVLFVNGIARNSYSDNRDRAADITDGARGLIARLRTSVPRSEIKPAKG